MRAAALAAALLCAAGCQESKSSLACGAGTHREGAQCLADAPGVDGGVAPDGAAAPDAASVIADMASVMTDDAATPTSTDLATAGGASYEVRVAAAHISADGYSALQVLAIGTLPDGSPATDRVILTPSVAGRGQLEPSTVTLGALGASSYYVACSVAADPSCTGDVSVVMSLAASPTTQLAVSRAITLVTPAGVGDPTPCLGGGNVLFFNGDSGDYIHPGIVTITAATWMPMTSPAGDLPSDVTINVTPTASAQGLWWNLDFSSAKLSAPLAVQVYDNAERAAFAEVGHPGLDIGGDGRGCNMITGQFQIEDLSLQGGTLKSFTATFEQHCEGATAALHGCVHFAQ
jgi:hypothetical protein